MKKSDLARKPYAGRRICHFSPVMGERCHEPATVELEITSYLTDPDETLISSSLLCEADADRTVGYYEREWAASPERFLIGDAR